MNDSELMTLAQLPEWARQQKSLPLSELKQLRELLLGAFLWHTLKPFGNDVVPAMAVFWALEALIEEAEAQEAPQEKAQGAG